MEDNILYEIGVKFNFYALIPFLLFIVLLTLRIILPKFKKKFKTLKIYKITDCALLTSVVIILLISSFSAIMDVSEYKTLMDTKQNNSMITVTGEVNGYSVNPDGTETFRLGITEFTFDPGSFNYAYNTSVNNGGVIADGQTLKIGFTVYKGDFKILYIEDLHSDKEK